MRDAETGRWQGESDDVEERRFLEGPQRRGTELRRALKIFAECIATSPTTLSVGGECSAPGGARYTIHVDGHAYTCRGAPSKCPGRAPLAVAYDPQDPSVCRVAAYTDRLSPYERVLVAVSALFALTGLAGGAYLLSARLHRAEIADGASMSPARRRLRHLSLTALILLPLASLTAFALVTALALT